MITGIQSAMALRKVKKVDRKRGGKREPRTSGECAGILVQREEQPSSSLLLPGKMPLHGQPSAILLEQVSGRIVGRENYY